MEMLRQGQKPHCVPLWGSIVMWSDEYLFLFLLDTFVRVLVIQHNPYHDLSFNVFQLQKIENNVMFGSFENAACCA